MVLYKARTTAQNKVLFAQKLTINAQKEGPSAQNITATTQNELLLKKVARFSL